MLNKPQGVVSATSDLNDKTVIDIIADRKRKDLFPVGRLDKDTEGLLIITNDGELAHRLLSPKHHVDKVYEAIVKGKIADKYVEEFAKGLYVDSEFTAMVVAGRAVHRHDAVVRLERLAPEVASQRLAPSTSSR